MGKRVELVNHRFCCDKTTEAGADEVVFYVVGVCSDHGRSFGERFPDVGHIDMNDGDQGTNNHNGDSHCIDDNFFGRHIFDQVVNPGETWDIAVTYIEIDGGSTATAQQVTAAVLQEIPTAPTIIAGVALTIFNKLGGIIAFDSNDRIGSFTVQVRGEADGSIASGFAPGDTVNFESATATDMQCRFNGDGTNYLGQYSLFIH